MKKVKDKKDNLGPLDPALTDLGGIGSIPAPIIAEDGMQAVPMNEATGMAPTPILSVDELESYGDLFDIDDDYDLEELDELEQ